MTILSEVLTKIKELKAVYGYDFNIPNIYGVADFRRNEFVFLAKKAVREVIKEHEDELDRLKKNILVQKCMKAIMKLWTNPESYSTLEQIVEQAYEYAKN